jgi:hypothetical protein
MSESIYQPLTIEEIENLLHEAAYHKENHDGQKVARIQVRLNNGIRGMESPRQIDGPVAEKLNQVDEKFVHFLKYVAFYYVPTVARELHEIMEG